jgi:hypothetical protein
MDKIDPLSYITDIDPVPITPRDPTEWYDTVYIVINTETKTDDQIVWLLAQGWIVWQMAINNIGQDDQYYSYWMKRRVISGEKVLTALVEDYSNAYNDGREANDTRYDDIVTLYAVVSDEMQDELISLDTKETTYEALIEALITVIQTDHTSHDSEVSDDLDAWGTAQTTRINTQYDSELTKAQNDLIDRGMNNATLWASVSAGIERERAIALNEHNDRIIVQQLSLNERLYEAKTRMRDRVLAARDRLFASLHNGAMTRENMREKIITALCNFMERRTDSYPDLTAIGNAAAELGAGTAIQNVQP